MISARVAALGAGLLPVLLVSSCSKTDLSHRFPIGIFGVADPSHLRELRRLGFDSFQTYSTEPALLEEMAREARRRGMRMISYPYSLMGAPVGRTRRWPIEAWYLKDEPEVTETSPEELEQNSRGVRGWDPRRPQVFVIGRGDAAQRYAATGDILMLDWYPVPHLPLDSVADQLDLAVRGSRPGKPLWMVIQAFDWMNYPQKDPKKPRVGRFPDHREIRFMSYLAVLHGAGGLFYFTLKTPGDRTLLERPEHLQALARVAAEMGSMRGVFSSGGKAPLPVSEAPAGLEGGAWRHRGREYVVLLNRRRDASVPVPRGLVGRSWRPLFEPRRRLDFLLERSSGGLSLPPSRVLVLERDCRPWGLRCG